MYSDANPVLYVHVNNKEKRKCQDECLAGPRPHRYSSNVYPFSLNIEKHDIECQKTLCSLAHYSCGRSLRQTHRDDYL